MDFAQINVPLVEALQDYGARAPISFHTPGHKGGQGSPGAIQQWWGTAVLRADLPELPELDNLFAPQGAIAAAQHLAAVAFGAEQTWFLTNGSTCGVIAAILATCNPGDSLILARNCHRSAIAGLMASGARPIWVEPEQDLRQDLAYSLTVESIQQALHHFPQAKAVFLVAPTYHGVVGDVQAIAQVAHAAGVPLVVDEAHGAHFAFHPNLPSSALAAGADISIQSTHKVLSALTQAAMLHVQGSRIDRDRLTQSLHLLQSTSPNYLLLASLDAARQQMALNGADLMSDTLHQAAIARTQLTKISGLSVLAPEQAGESPGFTALDPTRLTVDVSGLGLSGFEVDEWLTREFNLTAELPTLRQLTFIVTLGTRATDIEQLVEAFTHLSQQPSAQTQTISVLPPPLLEPTQSVRSPRDAFFASKQTLPTDHCVGQISAELVCPYPPGIPVLVPGEAITATALNYLRQIQHLGGMITGCTDSTLKTLQVIAET